MRCFNRVLPLAGQNPGKLIVSTGFCFRRARILENEVFQQGSASGGSESWKMMCFLQVLPPAGQNPEKGRVSTGFCLRRVRILENNVFQLGSASGGSESWKMTCFNRVLPPAGQNPGKIFLFDVSKASNTFPRHPRGLHY